MKHEYYYSTACIHGDEIVTPDGLTGHLYCQGNTGAAGDKIPAQCKFCDPPLPCMCACHEGPGCPRCHGRGLVPDWSLWVYADGAPEPSIPCDACRGTGRQ